MQLHHRLDDLKYNVEWVISIVIDIRGFTTFSTKVESQDVATYIKRFYKQLSKEYFKGAGFYKPTGDGLLIIYNYNRDSVVDVTKDVLENCVRCVREYPGFLLGDDMINFKIPDSIGIGVARGSATRLKDEFGVFDYSGKIINLSAKLNNIARPSGIAVSGDCYNDILEIKDEEGPVFNVQKVNVQGIEEAQVVYYSREVDPIINWEEVSHNSIGLNFYENDKKTQLANRDSFDIVLPERQDAIFNKLNDDESNHQENNFQPQVSYTDMLAAGYMVRVLKKAGFTEENIITQTDNIYKNKNNREISFDNHLVSICGPLVNDISVLIKKIACSNYGFCFNFTKNSGERILEINDDLKFKNVNTSSEVAASWHQMPNKKFEDCGLILNIENPSSQGKRIILIAGLTGIGTWAAAKYFRNYLIDISKKYTNKNYYMLIECEAAGWKVLLENCSVKEEGELHRM